MRTKNARPITAQEREHMHRVKSCACVLCDAPAPSEAHHVQQGLHFITVALCQSCHTGSLGVHGDKTMMRIKKWSDLHMINETIRRTLLVE